MNQIQKLTQAIRDNAGCELDYGTLRTLKMIDDESVKMERAFVGKPTLDHVLEENRMLKSMIDNGLGWEDMKIDI